MSPLALQLRSYRLTTAEILYHLPDHPALLQSFVWQQLDMAPEFPVLRKFLDFWARNIEGKLHPLDVKPGDRILFGKWSGSEVKIDGEELIIMKESDILGVIVGTASKRKAA